VLRLLAAFLTFGISALAADVTGRWWGEAVNAAGATSRVYVTLIQEGSTLRGMGGPTPNDQDVMRNGKISGNKLSFDILPGGRVPVHFDLVIEGEWLKGTTSVVIKGQTATNKISLRRRTQ
jgi:hypothetical protein